MAIETDRRNTDSLFFALRPDERAAARIASLTTRLCADYMLKASAIPAERLHITLHYLGAFAGVPADIVARACEAASQASFPSVDIVLDRVESFASRRAKRPLVLSGDISDALGTLQRTLGDALSDAGLQVRRRSEFKPHVTLLYDAQRIARQPVAPIAWTAREFALMRSLLGQSRYDVLARWPLAS